MVILRFSVKDYSKVNTKFPYFSRLFSTWSLLLVTVNFVTELLPNFLSPSLWISASTILNTLYCLSNSLTSGSSKSGKLLVSFSAVMEPLTAEMMALNTRTKFINGALFFMDNRYQVIHRFICTLEEHILVCSR